MKALALAIALSVDYTPKIQIPVTPGLAQSVSQYISLAGQVCKKLNTSPQKCGEEAEKEILKVREYVDKVCERIAPPNDQIVCIQDGVEAMIDQVLIPNKISLLQSKSI